MSSKQCIFVVCFLSGKKHTTIQLTRIWSGEVQDLPVFLNSQIMLEVSMDVQSWMVLIIIQFQRSGFKQIFKLFMKKCITNSL